MSAAFNRVAILGLGLIGGSLARVLSKKKLAQHIAAYNHSNHALEYALEKGFIDSGLATAGNAVANADLIIFATPPQVFSGLAAEIASHIARGAVLMDVGSVKRQAIAAIKPHMPDYTHYVPAHPIAGSDKSGIEAGNAELFSGRSVILTPEEAELNSDPVTRISLLWKQIGSRVEFMPPEMHDSIYAYVSHLPHIVAFAIAPLMDKSFAENAEYARFLRLTHSSPALWADICLANADYAGQAMEDFIRFAAQMHGELKENSQNNENGQGNVSLLFATLIATCLVATASLVQDQIGVNPLRYAGTGFADMTALAVHDPQELLAQISAHTNVVAALLGNMLERLQAFRAAIAGRHYEALVRLFSQQ